MRRYLAWESILLDQKTLDLSPFQVPQAEEQKRSADLPLRARLPETYQWLLVPTHQHPKVGVAWQAIWLNGQETLAARASKKLRSDELLVMALAGTRLRTDLDRIPLWRGDDVEIRQLFEDFARYLYLPRLKHTGVLTGAVRDGLALLTWERDSFAYADSFDQVAGRYRGLRGGQQVTILDTDAPGFLVKPEVARANSMRRLRGLRKNPKGDCGRHRGYGNPNGHNQ